MNLVVSSTCEIEPYNNNTNIDWFTFKLGDYDWLGLHNDESIRLPPLCPVFDFWTQGHMFVELVAGSI